MKGLFFLLLFTVGVHASDTMVFPWGADRLEAGRAIFTDETSLLEDRVWHLHERTRFGRPLSFRVRYEFSQKGLTKVVFNLYPLGKKESGREIFRLISTTLCPQIAKAPPEYKSFFTEQYIAEWNQNGTHGKLLLYEDSYAPSGWSMALIFTPATEL